jgi:hypothetical protein
MFLQISTGVRERRGVDLHHLETGSLNLLLSLNEVARIDPKKCILPGNDDHSCTSGKATYPSAAPPSLTHIFTLMWIGPIDNPPIKVMLIHEGTEFFNPFVNY